MCDCIKKIDDKLAENEQCLNVVWGIGVNPSRPLIGLIRKDRWQIESRRNKPKHMIASFCPFCGEKYDTSKGDNIPATSE